MGRGNSKDQGQPVQWGPRPTPGLGALLLGKRTGRDDGIQHFGGCVGTWGHEEPLQTSAECMLSLSVWCVGSWEHICIYWGVPATLPGACVPCMSGL